MGYAILTSTSTLTWMNDAIVTWMGDGSGVFRVMFLFFVLDDCFFRAGGGREAGGDGVLRGTLSRRLY